MAPKHIAIISKSEQISIVFIRIRLKIVLQMYGNLLTKSIRFLPFGVRLRVFWCVTYIEIVHQNTYSTAKSPKMRHQIDGWRVEQHIDQRTQLIARGTKAKKYLQQVVHHGKKHGGEQEPARFLVVERGVWLEKARRKQQQCQQRHHRHSTGLKDQQIIGNYHISIFHATKRQEHTTRTPLSISHISAKI